MNSPQLQKRKINDECFRLYEEICYLQERFRWTQADLCEKVYVAGHDNDHFSEEKDGIRKLKEQVKKMFQRKNWAKNKATKRTLHALEKLRDDIYRTDTYRHSDLAESDLPIKIRQGMEKQSEELQKWLVETDYEK